MPLRDMRKRLFHVEILSRLISHCVSLIFMANSLDKKDGTEDMLRISTYALVYLL